MKKCLIRALSLVMTLALLASCLVFPASAATYRTGANSVSASYAGGKYYQNYQKIPITGDGVTDVLAIALSQLGYTEGTSVNNMAGNGNSSSNYTEYNYNIGKSLIGDYGGSKYPWCAAFVSWCLYQSHCTDQGSEADLCRNHFGDSNYIWREIGCGAWISNLKSAGRFSLGASKGGTYTPQAGDLIFFRSGGHIGIVMYVKDGRVYTVEGNTSDASGLETNGGGVYFKNYSLSFSEIDGYGRLPYATNSSVSKVDYSGANPTAGLWITNAYKYLYADEACTTRAKYGDGVNCDLPRFTMFEAYGVTADKKALKVNYDGVSGYIALNEDRVLQVTSTASADEEIELSNNVAAGKSYTTSLLYRQGGQDVQWAYDKDQPIDYDDEGGKSLTDGSIANNQEYTNTAWAGLHYKTPDATEKGYAWITVDLGDYYDISECRLYVPVENFAKDAGVVRPSNISFWASVDGVNYQEIGTASYSNANDCTDVAYVNCNVTAKYIEARIAHGGWIFVSEIAAAGTVHDGPIDDGGNGSENEGGNEPSHTHNPSDIWKGDEAEHWLECSCGEKSDIEAHSGEWIVSEDDNTIEILLCTVCGYQMDSRTVAEDDFLLGDVNDSKGIDMMDYILLKRNYFGTYDFDEAATKRGDVNKSGAIDMMDYILLKRVYFGTYILE